MKFKIDRKLLPIKAHFFFFFAALGPLLPQMNVFGRQLGISADVMGMVTAVLPLLWAAAKPLFGYVVDFWPSQRKLVFMLLIVVMTGSYCGLWFLPMPEEPESPEHLLRSVYQFNDTVQAIQYKNNTPEQLQMVSCHWSCEKSYDIQVLLPNTPLVNSVYVDEVVNNTTCSLLRMNYVDFREGRVICAPKENCNLMCFEEDMTNEKRLKREVSATKDNALESGKMFSKITKEKEMVIEDSSVYMTGVFWVFVVLMCVGTVAFNVANCIGDAVCFDVLGPEGASKYGAQRAWGTAGYGITALLGGWLVDAVSGTYKDFTPAFVVAIVATAIDLYSCRALTLPSLTSPEDSGKALRDVLRMPRVLIFIVFAVVAGTFDSFIIYYMFWFLEELAEQTGCKAKIKLIEGVVVAAQSFIGELLFFFFSGKIIKRWGYRATLTFSLFCYGVRLALISFIQHPWHLVFIEAIMQGPTYALCYSTIVGYAAHVAPEGYSATIQGIVAGMDDGVGFAFGSLLGGQLYARLGGRWAFRTLAGTAVVAAFAHAMFSMNRHTTKTQAEVPAVEEGEKMLPTELDHATVYRDTVVPLAEVKQQADR
ncbi:major facilitator superfamily domain-containing protein 6 [Battus philenor]|uniref:major facilitator superfamily domain-containing protein 6 n=1 Tax=Battus philenor TaxID=42288 RepID=UPI0035CEDE20